MLAVTKREGNGCGVNIQAVKGGYFGTFQHYVRSGGSRHTAELDVQRTLSI